MILDDPGGVGMAQPKRNWRAGAIGFLLLLLLALPAPRQAGSNVMARFAAAVQLVEKGDLSLGPYGRLTNDAAVHRGRAYNDKAPGVTLAVAPIYAVVRLATRDFNVALRWCRVFSLLPLTLFTVWLLWRRLPAWGVDGAVRDAAAVGYAVGATTWPYFTMLYSHGFAADFILLGVLFLTDYRREPGRARPLLLAGLLFGAAIAFEYPTAALGLIAGVYLLSFERRPARLAAFVALGVVLPALIIGGYNYLCFDSPLNFGYTLEKDLAFRQHHTNGLMGFGAPRPATFWLLAFSPEKGLFFWSPALLFGAVGAAAMVRRLPREGWPLAGMAAVYIVLFAGYFEAGGAACLGPRHLTPIIGPLFLAAAWCTAQKADWRRGGFLGAAVLSSLIVWAGVFSDPQMPERLRNPLWDFAMPMLAAGVGPGNLFGLSDSAAAGLGLLLLAALWTIVLLGDRPRGPESPRLGKAAALTILVGLLFYLGLAPHLPRTEPGMLHQIRGNHFLFREDFGRAANEYEAAIATRADPWILYYQAKAYLRLGDRDKAAASWSRMMQLDPSFRPPGAEAPPALPAPAENGPGAGNGPP